MENCWISLVIYLKIVFIYRNLIANIFCKNVRLVYQKVDEKIILS